MEENPLYWPSQAQVHVIRRDAVDKEKIGFVIVVKSCTK